MATLVLVGFVFLAGLAYLAFQKNPVEEVRTAYPVIALIVAAAVVWFVATVFQMKSFGDPKGLLSVAGTIFETSIAISTALIGIVILGDKLSVQQTIGILLAIAGTLLLSF